MIKNIVFDFGGVLLDLRPDRCISEFKKIGIPEIEQMLSLAHQKGVLDSMERGRLSLEAFCDAIRSAHTGAFERMGKFRSMIPFMKDGYPIPAPTNRQVVMAFSSMCDGIPAYRLDFVRQLRKEGYHVSALSNTNPIHWNYCLRYFVEAGYDPREAVTFWQRMAASSTTKQSELLSDHPSDEKRIANIQGWMPEALQYYKPQQQVTTTPASKKTTKTTAKKKYK